MAYNEVKYSETPHLGHNIKEKAYPRLYIPIVG